MTPTSGSVTPSSAAPIPRRSVVSWVFYDLANTIFSMGIVSLYFSLYVREQVGPERADGVYAFTTAVSMGSILVLSPLLGAITDQAPRRVPFLAASTVICIAGTLLLGWGGLVPSLICFAIANAAYQAGLQFYDALLPEVSTDANRGWIGGVGIGVGYLGSFLAIGTGLVMLQGLGTTKPALFRVLALLFLLFAWPSFVWIRERGNPNATPLTWRSVVRAARQVVDTLHQSHRYPGLFRFLIGRVFYTDAVNTVISIMGLYVTNAAIRSGLDRSQGEASAQVIMLVAVVFAVCGGLVWGRIVDRLGPGRTLAIVLWVWMADFAAVALAGLARWPLWTFYLTGTVAGLALGGTWAADRPLMICLTPRSRVGEFFGLYGMVGRFSAVTGPLLWGLIVGGVFAGRPDVGQPLAVLMLLLMVLAGYLILRPVWNQIRSQAPEESTP